MLKRLELVGFKSFADKTPFDFSGGITAIVGPNGSGKSNIVDAVRWVLGEQSAKSLRGGEMADVIFNGSTSRRSLGLAEVTLTFDNRAKSLSTDADEVQITRRVYRDGEGEYLINGQPSRLKDIKDLFLGSGAGADAYCIIEQGRVDVLLQASTKERRTIFEEAAGISRFKARKTETLRKLERVDQNLQRLKDIVDEVEKQLRSVKLQAAKAQRYQEYAGRLKELRVGLGLREYHELVGRLQTEQAVLDSLRTGLAEQAAQAEAWETTLRRLEEELTALDAAAREQDGLLGRARQHIAAEETTLGHEWALSSDLETDLVRTRGQVAELKAKVVALADAADRAARELATVETGCLQQRRQTRALDDALQAVIARLNELHAGSQADKAEHFEEMRRAGRLQNDVVSRKVQLDSLRRSYEQLRVKTEQAAEHLASISIELKELQEADESLQGRLSRARQTLVTQRQERDRLKQRHEQTSQLVADLRAERSGVASRVEVLEGLERSHEGLGTGVREVLALTMRPEPGPWSVVLGMTADFLSVRREYAPLIDLALGDRAQCFLVRAAGLIVDALLQRGQPFSGRVSFLPLKDQGPEPSDDAPPLHPGVVALAAQVVTCDHPELSGLPRALLGRTLIVRDLAAARLVTVQASGWRCVTLRGELLETDGTLTVGTHHAETGILSRKSELREQREQVIALDHRIADAERELIDLREQAANLDSRAAAQQEEIDVLAERAADLRSRIQQHRERRQGLHEEVTLNRSEISGVEQEMQVLDAALRQSQTEAAAAERQVQELQEKIDRADREAREREQQRQQQEQAVTTAKVALAQVEERVAALRARHRQTGADLEQRQLELTQGEQHATAARARLGESQRTMLQASAALAEWYVLKESAEHRLASLTHNRAVKQQERQQLTEQAQASRSAWQGQQEQAHSRELEVSDLRHRRETLIGRLREDYQLDLASIYIECAIKTQRTQSREEDAPLEQEPHEASEKKSAEASSFSLCLEDETFNATAANEEIDELRRKLVRLGSVNLDSLQELAELEMRAATLQAQFNDLTTAKRGLEEIIAKINQDSRRLFGETLATVRTHFQELFRKLFGGGMADIVLEDENDILETGIEIIARPPGKELRSISLMSGGEKTMTAVALLLAIFRSRPSPFCILDEVDAALDEANIGRFSAVLRDFLDRSHFILITHSKRTMAAADVLYGITMQESGVSKRVAVRFEDWPDEGILPAERNGDATSASEALAER